MVKFKLASGDGSAARPSDDAVSLHTQPGDRYLDDDAPELEFHGNADDLPPEYTETENGESSSAAPLLSQDPMPDRIVDPLDFPPKLVDANTGAHFYINKALDLDPEALERWICRQAATAPQPAIKVVGTHTETRREKNENKKQTVTDFDIEIDLTPYLFSDATNRASWRSLHTVDNGRKTRRGTVLRKRAPGFTQDIEVGGTEKPSLREWCHRYCASAAGLKSFQLKREVIGLDTEGLGQRIEALIRGLNYRGHLRVSFPTRGGIAEVYNDCRTSHWRLTTWISWVCTLTLMFIFTWPYLFFRTKRFEVVTAEWPFSRPLSSGDSRREHVSITEEQLYNMWARALGKAVLERRQGTLNQEDLRNAEGRQPAFQSGNQTVDGAMGLFRAGMNAMNEINRANGWGGDS